MSYFKVYRPRSQAQKKHTLAFFCFPSMAHMSNELRYLQRVAADIPVSNQADQPWQVVQVLLVVYGMRNNLTKSSEPWPALSGSNNVLVTCTVQMEVILHYN